MPAIAGNDLIDASEATDKAIFDQEPSSLQKSPPRANGLRSSDSYPAHQVPARPASLARRAATVSQIIADGSTRAVQQPGRSVSDPFRHLCKDVRAPGTFSKRPVVPPRPLHQSQPQSQSLEAFLSGYQAPAQPTPRNKISSLIQDRRPHSRHQDSIHEQYFRLSTSSLESNSQIRIVGSLETSAPSVNDYDQDKMKILEQMFVAMGVASSTAETANADLISLEPIPNASRPSLSPSTSYTTRILESSPRTDFENNSPRQDATAVRLTPQVCQDVLRDRHNLQAEVRRLSKKHENGTKENVTPTQPPNIRELSADPGSSATLDLEIRQKDQISQDFPTYAATSSRPATIPEVKALELELAEARSDHAASKAEAESKLSYVIVQKDLEIAKLQQELSIMGENIQAVAGDRDRLAHGQRPVDPFAKSRQHLINALALKEKENHELMLGLEVGRTQTRDLTKQLQELHKRPDLSERIHELEAKAKQANNTADRLREENRAALKRVELQEESYKKITGDYVLLRGGAHLVQPSQKSKLSKNVMGCLECYMRNLTCDHRAQCQNCVDNNEVCRRWRCSLQHMKKGTCPDYPNCKLRHDGEGWLISTVGRPQW